MSVSRGDVGTVVMSGPQHSIVGQLGDVESDCSRTANKLSYSARCSSVVKSWFSREVGQQRLWVSISRGDVGTVTNNRMLWS